LRAGTTDRCSLLPASMDPFVVGTEEEAVRSNPFDKGGRTK